MKSIIGYAQADFKTLITDGKLYIDRTAFIETMENQSNTNLILVRPRRFGKSLWISILQYYYGAEHKALFDTLFGHLAIGQNPTPSRNSYMILTFQFSGIDVETESTTYQGFRRNVLIGILDCMTAYSDYFSKEDRAKVEAIDIPANILQMFFSLYKLNKVPYPIYILIDEYDQFANELVGLDTERFISIFGSSGYVRKYYEIIKFAVNQGVVKRFFATGVSPLTVDAMTSGFNISSSLNVELEFSDLMGFKTDEVIDILRKVGAKEENIPTIITDLKDWYDGYLFHEEATERLYNSDMIMYFASHYEKRQLYPSRMLDANIATDYKKVKKVFTIQQREAEFTPILKELTSEGILSAKITDFFNLEDDLTDEDIISLLYYMGWISIVDVKEGLHRFKIPNRVITELYYDYFVNIVERETGLNRKVSLIRKALAELSSNNNPHPFLEIIRVLIEKDLSLRDAQSFDEKHLKMLLIPYLSLSATHYVVSEPEWEKLYPDIVLFKRPNVETRYTFIIELKYIKMSDENKLDKETKERYIEKVENEARLQLQKYIQTENARRIPNLKAWLLILVGRTWHLVEEIPVLRD